MMNKRMILIHFLVLLPISAQALDFGSQAIDFGMVSRMGPDLNRAFDAEEPRAAYNPDLNEYLVVWSGNTIASDVLPEETEIYAQRISAADGSLLGGVVRVSEMGPSLTLGYDANKPDVSYNPLRQEYVVVWHADHHVDGQVEGELEIFMRALKAGDGSYSTPMIRVSNMGPAGQRSFDALDPVLEYNSVERHYLVVWRGEDDSGGPTSGEFEIYARQVSAEDYGLLGDRSVRVSAMGPDGDPVFDAYAPDLAFSEEDNRFLVVWYGDHQIDDHFDVYAMALDGQTALPVWPQQRMVSALSSDAPTRNARFPAISHNPIHSDYFVVWMSDDAAFGLNDDEFEIFGVTMNANGSIDPTGAIQISQMGENGESVFDAFDPAVIYQSTQDQYVVAWRGDLNVDGEFEIYSQRLDADRLTLLGQPTFRQTHAGPDSNLLYDARNVSLTQNTTNGSILVLREEENENGVQSEGDFEIHVSLITATAFSVSAGVSGSWFDATHDGEGWVLQVISPDTALLFWFTYDTVGHGQSWMVGNGRLVANRLVFDDLVITGGTPFGNAFNPNEIVREQWGQVAIEFDSCHSASMNYLSLQSDYGRGRLDPVRLSSLAGNDCIDQGITSSFDSGLSGVWFDPSHDGEGWVIEQLNPDQLLLYWFTYTPEREQAWLIGLGSPTSEGFFFENLIITSGATFGPAFDPNLVQRESWGSLNLVEQGCDSILLEYDSINPGYDMGVLNATVLARPVLGHCAQ